MGEIVILGVFVADLAFRAHRQPVIGETLMGCDFALGPGGKGSNQAVAAARLGANVSIISRLGDDAFAQMARATWKSEGIQALAKTDAKNFTGAAYIYIEEKTGDNAIIVVPGAAGDISPEDVEEHRGQIEAASLFMTQLETPADATLRGLAIARQAKVTTVFNPAPAAPVDDRLLELSDYLTPNESEAAGLTGIEINGIEDARLASTALRDRGANTVIVTLGENGAFFDDGRLQKHIKPLQYGKVVETTGAGDSFCGALAFALTNELEPIEATRYACAAASISVTRPGTAPAMPNGNEVKSFYESLA